MKNEMKYFTLEEKMEVIRERIIEGGFEDFDMNYSAEEIDEMFENDTYYDLYYASEIGVEGYEGKTNADLLEMPYEDILAIHNIITGSKITLKEIDEMEVFLNGSQIATTTMLDKDGDLIVVPMWMAL